jgi:2-succinyl-6-hydroxy-2,4-cyclohexadiene-1-carboxylate synthase
MGGRMALRALLNGAAFRSAVIVSAGLGIEGEPARARRRQADETWARRFENEDWSSVMSAWNAQPVFDGHEKARDERDFDRAELARALREWSPAVLAAVADRLEESMVPVRWVAGERDAKYVAEAKRASSSLPNCELWICPEAAHRVPWEEPARFIERILAFV